MDKWPGLAASIEHGKPLVKNANQRRTKENITFMFCKDQGKLFIKEFVEDIKVRGKNSQKLGINN